MSRNDVQIVREVDQQETLRHPELLLTKPDAGLNDYGGPVGV
jgi:hypothetical protein